VTETESNDIKLLSAKFKVQAAVLKVSRLIKDIPDEKFQEVINESMIYRPVNVVQKLDLNLRWASITRIYATTLHLINYCMIGNWNKI
jgi:hypothetical protein